MKEKKDEVREVPDNANIIELGISDIYLPSVIDLTCLKPGTIKRDIFDLCRFAVTHQYRAVCVNQRWTSLCVRETKGSKTKVAIVTDFPLGAGGLRAKNAGAYSTFYKGAHEIDTVISMGDFRDGNINEIRREINIILPTKVIIETGYWNDGQIRDLTKIVMDAGAFCIKTSTGWEPKVPLREKARHVAIMREEIEKAGSKLLIKAAGGIKTTDDARLMLRAGADIIGTSARIL